MAAEEKMSQFANIFVCVAGHFLADFRIFRCPNENKPSSFKRNSIKIFSFVVNLFESFKLPTFVHLYNIVRFYRVNSDTLTFTMLSHDAKKIKRDFLQPHLDFFVKIGGLASLHF